MREYVKFTLSAFAMMMLGAQSVHVIYRPLEDLPQVIEKMRAERKKLREEEAEKLKSSAVTGS